MAIARISEARLRLIMKRQWKQAWGQDYVPAIWATPREAPGLSTATILHPEKLGGRPFHTLSRNETWVSLLALYHPCVWDIHEQRALFPQPRPHFLYGHPLAGGEPFPPFRGTLSVAERMGILPRHPKCRVQVEGGCAEHAPFPYIGDLLVFLSDEDGPYLINLTVKDKMESFRRRGPRPGKPAAGDDEIHAVQRHALERTYYEDAGIPTRQVVGRAIDQELRANLHDLFLSHAEPVPLSRAVQATLYQYFQDHVGSTTRADLLVRNAAQQLGVDAIVIRNVLMQGVWSRQIRVDLFRPFLIDRPLRPETDDPIAVYRDWLAR